MIKEIHMKECATYNEQGAALLDCKKVNYIYGANGSGKSTISSFLYDLNNMKYTQSSVVWDSKGPVKIEVYDRRFRETNFKQSSIEGVFTLGEANIEDIAELEKLKTELEACNNCLSQTKENIKKQEGEKDKRIIQFRDDVWNSIYKRHEGNFKDAFDGCRRSKDKFCQEVINRSQTFNSTTEQLSSLQERANTLYASELKECNSLWFDISKQQKVLEAIHSNPILESVIVGNDNIPIAKLISSLGNADWIRMGRKYVLDSATCPFCQKETIDSNFKRQLEQFFDDEYEKNIQIVTDLLRTYKTISDDIVRVIENAILDTDSVTVGKLDKVLLESKVTNLLRILTDNQMLLNDKLIEPGKKIQLEPVGESLEEIIQLFDSANKSISDHNQLIKNISAEKQKLSNDIWAYCLHEQKVLIEGYNKDIDNLDKSIIGMKKSCEGLNEKGKHLQQEVIEKGKSITSVEPTVNEMNRLLKAYGFNGFQIVPSKEKDNHYQIQRQDGSLVNNTLSEGEETFISFLYFMQLTKGATDAERISAKRIIVLDDPICSLDSTILYIVSTMVKQLSQDIRDGVGDVEQLFVLTHNVFFHKEASFINGRTGELKDVNYWIIKKDCEVSRIVGYGMKNPISTSYELLWKELKESEDMSLVTLQNTMRRIIENYFGLLGGGRDSYIKGKFDTVEEQTICESLFYWINDGSHSIPDDLFVGSYTDSSEKYKEIFYQIFKKTGHEAHYNMMMGIEDDYN